MSTRLTEIRGPTSGSSLVGGARDMDLNEVTRKYLEISGGYGRPVALADFGLAAGEIERVFSAFDEDYHISRFFHFSADTRTPYHINGFEHTHVAIDAEIQSIL